MSALDSPAPAPPYDGTMTDAPTTAPTARAVDHARRVRRRRFGMDTGSPDEKQRGGATKVNRVRLRMTRVDRLSSRRAAGGSARVSARGSAADPPADGSGG